MPREAVRLVQDRAHSWAEGVSRTRGVSRHAALRAYEEALAIPPNQVSFDRLDADAGGAILLRRGSYGLDVAEWWRVTASGLDAVFSLDSPSYPVLYRLRVALPASLTGPPAIANPVARPPSAIGA
jgi:hypothetical protein